MDTTSETLRLLQGPRTHRRSGTAAVCCYNCDSQACCAGTARNRQTSPTKFPAPAQRMRKVDKPRHSPSVPCGLPRSGFRARTTLNNRRFSREKRRRQTVLSVLTAGGKPAQGGARRAPAFGQRRRQQVRTALRHGAFLLQECQTCSPVERKWTNHKPRSAFPRLSI